MKIDTKHEKVFLVTIRQIREELVKSGPFFRVNIWERIVEPQYPIHYQTNFNRLCDE